MSILLGVSSMSIFTADLLFLTQCLAQQGGKKG